MEKAHNYKIYLFVNSRSGGGEGQQYLTLKSKRIQYKFQPSTIATVSFFDLFNQEQRNNGMAQVAKLSHHPNQNDLIRVIICGGDGTIMWVIGSALQHQVNFQNIVFGILPIGTGNDFSRCLGWGSQTVKFNENNLSQLNSLVHQWVHAGLSTYDIWDIEIQTFQNGAIYDIKNKVEHKRQEKIFKKSFTNYVGLGIDARVVYTCQRKRSSIACLTKIIYGCVGFCNFFRSINKINQTMQSLSQSDTEEDQNSLEQPLKSIDQPQTANSIEKKFLPNFKESDTSDDYQLNREQGYKTAKQLQQRAGDLKRIWKQVCVKQSYTGLVCLNSPSYMAGLRQVWNTNAIGYKLSNGQAPKKFIPQLYNDGLIEFVGFKNELSLALERIMRCGGRITQGPGPFEIKMKQSRQNETIESYLQVDGESLKLINLKSILISKTTKIPKSQIKIMIKS